MKRIGTIGIIVEDRNEVHFVQDVLTEFSGSILGRMGIPDKEDGISVIAIIVKDTNEKISALCGKLGNIKNVSVKSALSAKILQEGN